ncbi:MAG: hypothetical protein KA371_11240 [Acidobacteria bacterium]|nr:hypothetical protein [Acidobacteriota bacterium]
MTLDALAAWPAPLLRRATPAAGETGAGLEVGVRDLAEPQGPSMLTVRRTASEDVQDRQVYLSLDGEDWATLYYGKAVTREVAPGRHTLKANNTLVRKSVAFDVKPGEHVRYQCINKAHWTAMMFMAFLGAAFLTVKLVREQDSEG